MPTANVKSSTRKIAFNYIISTPSSSSAKSIDKSLPTLLFIHAVYLGPQIFQWQFQDPQIRRFNCVAVDLRLHGLTTGDPLPEGYGAQEAAEDLALFMEEIKLPACHLVGLSMGTVVAVGLAVYYPNKVASLFLVSPLGLEELADVADGRRQIAEYWREGFKTGEPDMAVISDAVYGAQQLGFSNNPNSLANALLNISLPLALKKCVPENFDQYDRATIDFLNNRKEYTTEELSRIHVPVKLVHCLGDIAYPQEYTERFMQQLKDAAVAVSLATIPEAPHFGVVTHGDIVNQLLHNFIIASCATSVPPAPREVSSPWEAELIKAGWKECESDSEDD
ncbi:alpha/beta-hydrolase [Desarmillaria tabescens]|uniref:Alpha/beta-hydrolase n=1 Tax=Armillaria tabescens TaxID=1929756 RepID=A0AA39JFN2_ARMTA|nr:alpha/beta-hydrolase [Desarmillaria tabescens]KAK0441524.1 alpha/beta-hydrolase [Desarmillaria tabescens]